MNMMGKEWIVLGTFKLKEWHVTQFQDRVYLVHGDDTICDFFEEVEDKPFTEILDLIAAHRCPITYEDEDGEEVIKDAVGQKE